MVGHVRDLLREVNGLVLGYEALPDEVACPIGSALPRLGHDGSMTLHRVPDRGGPTDRTGDGPRHAFLETHALGFRQPPVDAPEIAPADLAAVLVPGRLFDHDGYRLGRGGGHYDRLLPLLRPGTPVIGLTTQARVVERLPREAHDVPMTHLATEQGIIPVSS